MECVEGISVTWYVVFTDTDVQEHWIHSVLKKGFKHCYCFRRIGGHIFYVDPTTANIDSKIFQWYPVQQLADELSNQLDTKVLEFKYPFDINNRTFNIWNLVPTCVSVVKMFLGVKARAQTPYQLYKQLLSRGAQAL